METKHSVSFRNSQKMKCFCSLIFLWCLAHSDGISIVKSSAHIALGASKEIGKLIPTPEEIFNTPLQALVGLPQVAYFSALKQMCSLYMSSDEIRPRIEPDVEAMEIRLYGPCNQETFPLLQSEDILQSPYFDVNKKVAIFVSGWGSTGDEEYIGQMAEIFNCRGNYNFLVLKTPEAIRTLYAWSAYNTEEVGRQLALSLIKLVDQVPPENMHLIGISLGAHIMGHAGRYFNEYSGLNISRITGLDPANPCFNEGENLSGLQRGDADFIDVIHSNYGVLGTKSSVGDVDFYPGGLAPIQPGCTEFGCSHRRSVYYFIESAYPGNEYNFMGTRCTSLTRLNRGLCNGPSYPMGFATPYNLKGNYFLSVNSEAPFGKNGNSDEYLRANCGKCNE